MMSLKNSVVHHKKRTMKRFKISSWFFFLIEIRQEDYYVSLYDAAYQYADDNHHDPESMKHFQIPYHDFINFLTSLDEIQKNKPEKCLLIIHKHGGISLQADPIVMKRYFDDGKPFDTICDAQVI